MGWGLPVRHWTVLTGDHRAVFLSGRGQFQTSVDRPQARGQHEVGARSGGAARVVAGDHQRPALSQRRFDPVAGSPAGLIARVGSLGDGAFDPQFGDDVEQGCGVEVAPGRCDRDGAAGAGDQLLQDRPARTIGQSGQIAPVQVQAAVTVVKQVPPVMAVPVAPGTPPPLSAVPAVPAVIRVRSGPAATVAPRAAEPAAPAATPVPPVRPSPPAVTAVPAARAARASPVSAPPTR